MALYIGIDSGTQSVKAVALDLETRRVIAEARAPHTLIGGLPVGHMEQQPQEWTDAMDRVNPVYIPRNHKVEEALTAATRGDLGPVSRLVDVIRDPYSERPGLEAYAEPGPDSERYVTFCGT